MRILMVTSFYPPYHVGGACMHVYHLANELAQRGHHIEVLYSPDAYYLKRKNDPKIKYPNHKNIVLHPIKSRLGKFSPLTTYITGKLLSSLPIKKIFERNFDLIHYHNISLFGPEIFTFGSAPKIYTAHDHWLVCPLNDFFREGAVCTKIPSATTCTLCLMQNNRPPQLWRLSNKLRVGLSSLQSIITPSHYLKNFLIHHLQISSHDIPSTILPPITVLPNFVPKPPKLSLKKESFFFYAGMIELHKGIQQLVNAFAITKKSLYIAGQGSKVSWLKQEIKRRNLKNITFLGYLSGNDKYKYFAKAQAFILPSECPENAPLTILEAYSVGTNAIGTNVGGIPEIINKNNPSLIVPLHNPQALAKTVENFEPSSPSTLQAIYKREYSPSLYIERYTSLVRRITTEKR